MIEVGIVGGTGYTGAELLRFLVQHPQARLRVITSRGEAGKAVAEVFPNLRGHTDLVFVPPAEAALASCDVVFFATPNGTAMTMARALLEAGTRVIDLAADFRLREASAWHHWYGMEHAAPELLEEAVYGLPEANRAAISAARLVANPGCYPTAVLLGLMPLMEAGVVDNATLVADTKSGASGGGRNASVPLLLCETGESFKAYGVPGHRHLPEIRQGLAVMAGGAVGLTFVPHLVPMIRGIHATLYGRLVSHDTDLQRLFEERYRDEPFVDVLAAGGHPETRSVRGTNMCRIAVHRPQQGDTAVVLSVIDNLAKGAASQAIQNMNIMHGLPEATGLGAPGLLP